MMRSFAGIIIANRDRHMWHKDSPVSTQLAADSEWQRKGARALRDDGSALPSDEKDGGHRESHDTWLHLSLWRAHLTGPSAPRSARAWGAMVLGWLKTGCTAKQLLVKYAKCYRRPNSQGVWKCYQNLHTSTALVSSSCFTHIMRSTVCLAAHTYHCQKINNLQLWFSTQ